MSKRIAINGFGRIGRLAFRLAAKRSDMEVVAINDLVPCEMLAYLLKYDSIHGQFPGEIQAKDDRLIIDGKEVKVFAEKNPQDLPWKELGVDFLIESTGIFRTKESAQKHIDAGARRVVISAPAKGDQIPTFVMGVNHSEFNPSKHQIVSNASCTTNCLAPIVKVVLDNFGIEEGLMTTVHAVTSTQPTVDGPSAKDWRGGRGAYQNIIPSTTGAAKAVGMCIPEMKGKLTGMSLRVPVADVSIVDLTLRTSKETSYDEISKAIKGAADEEMKGIILYCDEPVVSSDFIGSTYSAIYDKGAGIGLNSKFFKLLAWYDNEMGYSARLVDFVAYMISSEKESHATAAANVS